MHETRQRIIEYLKEKRQATVDELALSVGLTPMAVRYHLNVLQADTLIEVFAVRRQNGPGRPQQVYKLTAAADTLFPEDYRGLTDYLLDELQERLGRAGVNEIFGSIAHRLADEAPVLNSSQPLEERLDAVIAFLSKKGFVVDWKKQNGTYLLQAHSCPYRQIVKAHQAVCRIDYEIIKTMLGVKPTRLTSLPQNDAYCSYRLP